jgi:hypothetical protein
MFPSEFIGDAEAGMLLQLLPGKFVGANIGPPQPLATPYPLDLAFVAHNLLYVL